MSPDKIALTLALGSTLATFPVLGTTSILSGIVAIALGLNQPLMQFTGWLFYPLQLLLLVPLFRAGEYLGAPHLALSLPQMMIRFRAGPGQFVHDFGAIALGGIGVWCLMAPPTIALLYFLARPAVRSLARKTVWRQAS